MQEMLVHIANPPKDVRGMVDAHIGLRVAALEVGGSFSTLQWRGDSGNDWSRRVYKISLPDDASPAGLLRAGARAGYQVKARRMRGLTMLVMRPQMG